MSRLDVDQHAGVCNVPIIRFLRVQTPSITGTPSATVTGSAAVRVGGKLWVELHAADYVPSTATWDNRASFGAVSRCAGVVCLTRAYDATHCSVGASTTLYL